MIKNDKINNDNNNFLHKKYMKTLIALFCRSYVQ